MSSESFLHRVRLNATRRASRIANSINSTNAFVQPNTRVVQLPNGTVMLATQAVNVPKKYLNLNKRFEKSLNNFPANSLNRIRNNNWKGASRADLIEFIMITYYSYFSPVDESNFINILVPSFHRAISKLTSRNRFNKSMIPVQTLYRLLIRLNKGTLLKLAEIIEW
jgi:hypothetical protein